MSTDCNPSGTPGSAFLLELEDAPRVHFLNDGTFVVDDGTQLTRYDAAGDVLVDDTAKG